MEIEIHIDKGVEENAAKYYDAAKKLKKKVRGAQEALETFKKELAKLEVEYAEDLERYNASEFEVSSQESTGDEGKEISGSKESSGNSAHKEYWFSKFRWTITSTGRLVVAGKDVNSNEELMKNHVKPQDLVFHTEMAGSPYAVLSVAKNEDAPTGMECEEVAQFVACMSRAWREGYSSVEVLMAKGEQFSKQANPGESLAKGMYMVRGKLTYFKPELKLAFGTLPFVAWQLLGSEHHVGSMKGVLGTGDGESASQHSAHIVVSGAPTAIGAWSDQYVTLRPGSGKPSALAKEMRFRMFSQRGISIDSLHRLMPSGGSSLGKTMKGKGKAYLT